jgi:hypothetical protein
VLWRVTTADDVHEDVMRERARAGERQARHDRQNGRERHRGDETEEGRAA